MRLFGSDRIVNTWKKMGLEEGQELEHPLLNRSIEQAQKRVEQHNYQIRKRTLEYDDVMNKQREVIYGFRNEIINSDDVRDRLMDIMEEVVIQKVEQCSGAGQDVAEWRMRALADWVNLNFPLGMPEEEIVEGRAFGAGNAGVRLHLRRPQRRAIRGLHLHFRQRPQGLRTQGEL